MPDPRVIVVSGGSRGLGEAIVDHFLARGDGVATFSRKRSPAVDRWEREPRAQGRLFYQSLDAADADALRDFVGSVRDRFGRVDVLINNAALAHDGVLPLMTEEKIDQMLDVNLRAAIVLAKECGRLMLAQGGGNIVSISSITAQRGSSGLAAYSATKAALEGMTRSLARELGPRHVRVNAVAPGYLETEMSQQLSDDERRRIIRRTPLGRLAAPADIVPCIEFLLSPAAAFITGQVISVDGGASI